MIHCLLFMQWLYCDFSNNACTSVLRNTLYQPATRKTAFIDKKGKERKLALNQVVPQQVDQEKFAPHVVWASVLCLYGIDDKLHVTLKMLHNHKKIRNMSPRFIVSQLWERICNTVCWQCQKTCKSGKQEAYNCTDCILAHLCGIL